MPSALLSVIGDPPPGVEYACTVAVNNCPAFVELTDGMTEKWSILTPVVKVTVAVWVIVIESVVSVAVKVADPPTVDKTVKVTTPEGGVFVEAGEIVTPPRLEPRLIVFPTSGFALASFRVTEMVEVVEPSAGTEVGLATTVELPATLTFAE